MDLRRRHDITWLQRTSDSYSQLLTLKSKIVLPFRGVSAKEDLFCRKHWRKMQCLANEFWNRWRKEYLPFLQERGRWTKSEYNLQMENSVLVMAENVQRCQWPKAIVVDTYPLDDRFVRKVAVKTSSANFDGSIYKITLFSVVQTGNPHQVAQVLVTWADKLTTRHLYFLRKSYLHFAHIAWKTNKFNVLSAKDHLTVLCMFMFGLRSPGDPCNGHKPSSL